MPLYLQDGALLLNGSQLASTRSCCCDAPCVCNRTVTYSYYDSVPPGKTYTECPNIGKCDGSSTGDCAGDVLDGFIVERFKKSCITNSTIRASLKSGSVVDDYGIIGGVETSNICGSLGVISGDHDISDQIVIEDDGDYVKAKIPISITNDEYLGGPHGLAGVTICWCCQSPTGSGCNECFPPPPPCCKEIASCQNLPSYYSTGPGTVYRCGQFSQQECNQSGGIRGGQNCTVGQGPGPYPPYDCVNGAFFGGAWVTVSGWQACAVPCPDIDEYTLSIFQALEAIVNGSYWVPLECGSRGGFSVADNDREIFIYVDVVGKYVSAYFSTRPSFLFTQVTFQGEANTFRVECNDFAGANCTTYGGTAMDSTQGPNGTITVSP